MERKSRRRILIFSTAYYPFVGGAEIAIREITKRLDKKFDFDLITARLHKSVPRREIIDTVNVYRIGFGHPLVDKLLLPFWGGVLAYRLHVQKHYASFWAMMVTFGSGAAYVSNFFNMMTGKKKVPIILTLQEGDSESHLTYRWGGLLNLSWRMALMQADTLTAISNFLLHRAKKHGYTKDSHLVPNGVDIQLFSQRISKETKDLLKLQLNKKDGDIFLVTAGRLTHKNAVDDIISALTRLPQNVSLLIIGKGDEGSRLQKLADILRVSDRVKFLGFMPYEDIPKYLAISDIFIRPSRSEGFGNSFIEAMAAKIPVIATPVGGITDFIDDRHTGVFCSPDNPASVAQAVTSIMGDPGLRERLVNNAYERVKERYGWDHIALEMLSVFDNVKVM